MLLDDEFWPGEDGDAPEEEDDDDADLKLVADKAAVDRIIQACVFPWLAASADPETVPPLQGLL